MEPWLKPMLATAVDAVPTGAIWRIQAKIDGWRVMFHRRANDVQVYGGRNGSDYSGRMPWLEAQVMALCPPDTAIDGELVGANGWGDVQGHMTRTNAGIVPEGALTVMVFDILRAAGTDIRSLRLDEREQLLGALAWDKVEHLQQIVSGQPSEDALKRLIEAGFEGAVCKRADSRYVNSRSGSWVKLKYEETHEAVVRGFKPGEGRWTGGVGAFEIEMLGDDGQPNGVRSRVKCGTDKVHEDAAANPERWLNTVIEIRCNGHGATGVPRHPRLWRRRDDRTPEARTPRVAPTTTRRPRMDWIRNYNAMGEAKLRRCIAELEAGRGDAVDRVEQNSGDVARNLGAAKTALHNKMGLPAR